MTLNVRKAWPCAAWRGSRTPLIHSSLHSTAATTVSSSSGRSCLASQVTWSRELFSRGHSVANDGRRRWDYTAQCRAATAIVVPYLVLRRRSYCLEIAFRKDDVCIEARPGTKMLLASSLPRVISQPTEWCYFSAQHEIGSMPPVIIQCYFLQRLLAVAFDQTTHTKYLTRAFSRKLAGRSFRSQLRSLFAPFFLHGAKVSPLLTGSRKNNPTQHRG